MPVLITKACKKEAPAYEKEAEAYKRGTPTHEKEARAYWEGARAHEEGTRAYKEGAPAHADGAFSCRVATTQCLLIAKTTEKRAKSTVGKKTL